MSYNQFVDMLLDVVMRRPDLLFGGMERPRLLSNASTSSSSSSSFVPSEAASSTRPVNSSSSSRAAPGTGRCSRVQPASTRYSPHTQAVDRRRGGGGGGSSGIPRLECGFCRRNGEARATFTTHVCKDPSTGAVVCPVLRRYACEICGYNGGDWAHTRRHCPMNPDGEAAKRGKPMPLILRQRVNSTGRLPARV